MARKRLDVFVLVCRRRIFGVDGKSGAPLIEKSTADTAFDSRGSRDGKLMLLCLGVSSTSLIESVSEHCFNFAIELTFWPSILRTARM